jgi:hypothetical protein
MAAKPVFGGAALQNTVHVPSSSKLHAQLQSTRIAQHSGYILNLTTGMNSAGSEMVFSILKIATLTCFFGFPAKSVMDGTLNEIACIDKGKPCQQWHY